MLERKWMTLGLVVALVMGLFALAEMGTNKTEKLANNLAKLLQRYPESDLNHDGKLTMDEGLELLKKHPELRDELLRTDDPVTSVEAVEIKSEVGGAGLQESANEVNQSSEPRVFVCGHSYMIFTAEWLPKLARLAELPNRLVGKQMLGGSQVIQHWNVPYEKNLVKRRLAEGAVDVLLLSPNATLPDEGINLFTKLGLKKQSNLRVFVQASWAPRDGKRGGGFVNAQRDDVTVEQLQMMRQQQREVWLKQLENQVEELNDSLGVGREVVKIVPVFDVVYALRERVASGTAPGLGKQSELFKDDHGHPSPVLALLVSYCHFAAIHQRNPIGLPVPQELKSNPQAEALNRLLQELAWAVVSTYSASGVGSSL